MSKLKPCPFCGSEAEEDFAHSYYLINCSNKKCPVIIMTEPIFAFTDDNYKKVMDKWNTRHHPRCKDCAHAYTSHETIKCCHPRINRKAFIIRKDSYCSEWKEEKRDE